MTFQFRLSSAAAILPLRTRHRAEMNCQIVHDSIHSRDGWTQSYLFETDGMSVGFASIAVGGTWTDKPTVIEFYVVPEHRGRVFELFETFLAETQPRFFEVQSNDEMATVMAFTYASDIGTEKIVFSDKCTTALPDKGARLRCCTPELEIKNNLEWRQSGGEWVLELDETEIAKGGILFHYNRPYGDIYMEVNESFRMRGFGSYLVQELKRICYSLGAIPCARCSPANRASRKTLQRAGFVPFAHILTGSFASY